MEAFHSSLFRNFGQYRTIRQESLTREFASEKGGKPPEYFVYFKVFLTPFWRKESVRIRRRNYAVLPKAIPHKSARESDERFFVRKRCKTAGILCVLQGFTNAFPKKKIRQNPKTHLCGVALVFRSPDASGIPLGAPGDFSVYFAICPSVAAGGKI